MLCQWDAWRGKLTKQAQRSYARVISPPTGRDMIQVSKPLKQAHEEGVHPEQAKSPGRAGQPGGPGHHQHSRFMPCWGPLRLQDATATPDGKGDGNRAARPILRRAASRGLSSPAPLELSPA